MSTRASLLLQTTRSLCTLFAHSAPLSAVSPLFTPSPTITEHGPPTPSVPFLRTFSGPGALEEYLSLLSRLLSISDAAYGEPSLDPEREIVCVKARARFTWLEGKGKGTQWEEEFVYVLSGFDELGRVGVWEVWADPLSAWLASQGRRVDDHD
ncbi:hypothetical protein CALVIDRAFT_560716 [Calocera viscosa TUFC12733]|uniref:Uncharacterized protein n=1 Tax=Calocera viscosa (strain TUFC12733) TaxID=1330018 RepID=A0A167QP69_CALVF|nr:hypothetical protein CALVIDRAFT_560716 [Calocera viscosa TUFC12733]